LVSIASQFGLRTFINIDTVLPKAVSPYSLSKAQFREWLTSFFHRKLCCVNFALEHFYGPDDERSKFVTWIIYSMLNNVPQLDLTAGEQKRDFIYIDDVVTAFEAVFRKSVTLANGFYSYEVGSGRNIAVSDLVRLIKSEVGNTATELNFGAVPYRTNEEMLSQVNLRNMNSLGWAPNVTLETGIRNVIDFEKRKLK
jgi:nucleoside-diphosphate-sugar epimerase